LELVKIYMDLLKIITIHFGGFKLWDNVERYLLGTDIYLDTSYFFRYLEPEIVKKFRENILQKRSRAFRSLELFFI